MHEIEPYFNWEKFYVASEDARSPLYNAQYNLSEYTNTIYGYYIHPMWDYIGSETLYVKILYANYIDGYVVIEMLGEWNDTLHNDIMHLKRNILDYIVATGINKFILIGEQVFNFHGSDDCYYEEWYEDIEDGWIAAVNFRDFVCEEWKKYNIDSYVNWGGELDIPNWRTMKPMVFCKYVHDRVTRRIGM